MSLTFKNYHLNALTKLLDIPLHGNESRQRNKFLKIISPLILELDEERKQLLSEFSDKEDGKPIIENDRYKLSEENGKKFQEKYQELLTEDCVLDELDSTKPIFEEVKHILLNSNMDLGAADAVVYDEICEVFEGK